MLAVAASSGCTVIRNEFRTLIAEPIKFGDNVDIVRTTKRNKKLAKEAFEHFEAHHAETPPSPDYRHGFIEGFADYLTFGGSGAPPVVPPRRYWNLPDRDPTGHTAVQDWFAGFAAGASEAKISGLREQFTVASSYVPVEEDIGSLNLEHAEEIPSGDVRWEPVLPPDSGSLQEEAITPSQEPQELPPLPPTDPSAPPVPEGQQDRNSRREPDDSELLPLQPSRPGQTERPGLFNRSEEPGGNSRHYSRLAPDS